MRIDDPFHLLQGKATIWPPNFLDIDATAKLRRSDGTLIMELPFRFDPTARTFDAVRTNNPFVPTLPAHFKWKEVVVLEIVLTLSYSIFVLDPKTNFPKAHGKGRKNLSQKWAVVYGEKGTSLGPEELKYLFPPPQHEGSLDITVEVKASPSSVEADSGIVKALLRLTAGFSTQGIGFSHYVDIPGETSAFQYGPADFEFRVAYLATHRPKDDPQVPADLLVHTVRFEEDIAATSDEYLNRIGDNWVLPLFKQAPHLAEAIATGKCPINLFGYASETGGNNLYNLTISAGRITDVKEAIKKAFKPYRFAGQPTFFTFPLGQSTVARPGRSPQEKRVEIVIDRSMAKGFLSKP